MTKIASTVPLYRELAETILGAIDDVVLIVNAMGRLLYVSSFTGEVLSQTPDYWVGQSALDLVHPEDLGEVVGRLELALATHEAPIRSTRIRIGSLGDRWLQVEAHGFNWIEFEGEPAVLVMIRDMTGRVAFRRAKQLASRTLEDDIDPADGYRSVFVNRLLPNMFIETDDDHQILIVQITVTNHALLAEARNTSSQEVLHATAERLQDSIRDEDLVARVGAGELVVVCSDLVNPIDSNLVTERLFHAATAEEGVCVRVGSAAASLGDDIDEVLDFIATADHFVSAPC